MTIFLEKFGTVLSSRQSGREAYAAYLPTLNAITNHEEVIVDFAGVSSFSPSWADEFITPLQEKFRDRIVLINTQNPSVALTIKMLEQIHGVLFTKT